MIEIDGRHGEGGGQILRTALALSLVTGQAFRIDGIRGGRARPGLAPQHLAGILAAATLCGATAEGATLDSTTLTFAPGGPVQPGRHVFDISHLSGRGSAGSVTLLLQSILPPLALAPGPSVVRVRGGTFVSASPPAHYTAWVLLPTLAMLGVEAVLTVDTWGWYPRGGGEVTLTIAGGATLAGVDLTARGRLAGVRGLAAVSNLPAHIPHRMASRLNSRLQQAGLAPRVEPLRTGGPSTGAGAVVALAYEGAYAGFSALGAPGKPSEVVADEVADRLIVFHRQSQALDEHLPDQLLSFLALAAGPSSLTTRTVTTHLVTSRYVIGRFLDRAIVIEGDPGRLGTVRVGA